MTFDNIKHIQDKLNFLRFIPKEESYMSFRQLDLKYANVTV